MEKEDRLLNLLDEHLKQQTKTLIIPLIVVTGLIAVIITIWLFSRKQG